MKLIRSRLYVKILFFYSLSSNKKNDNHFKVNQEFLIPYDLPPLKYNNTGKSEKNERDREIVRKYFL